MTDNKTDNTESSQQPSVDHPESVSQPKRGLLGSSFIVSMGTMLSRVLGLVRDVVLANLLGAHVAKVLPIGAAPWIFALLSWRK